MVTGKTTGSHVARTARFMNLSLNMESEMIPGILNFCSSFTWSVNKKKEGRKLFFYVGI